MDVQGKRVVIFLPYHSAAGRNRPPGFSVQFIVHTLQVKRVSSLAWYERQLFPTYHVPNI